MTPNERVLAMDLSNPTLEDIEYLHWLKTLAQKIFIRAATPLRGKE